MKYIEFFIDNWFMLVTLICIFILTVQRIIEFIALPTDKKKNEIKTRLLEWVRKAEADLGSETGKFKFSQVYNEFCKQYPEMKKWFTVEQFDSFVKETLREMQSQFQNEITMVNALKL